MENKQCCRCKQEYPVSEFYVRNKKTRSTMSYCKRCFNQKCGIRWNLLKIKYINQFGSKCQDCSIPLNDTNYSIFEFHHLDPSIKEFGWGKLRMLKPISIEKELEKTVVLCANCHRLRHSLDFQNAA